LCASMQVKKVKIEMERIFSSEKRDRAISEFGLLPSDIPLAIKGRVRQYPVDTLRNLLGEARARGKRRGIDVYIDPPYLIEDLDACYSDTALASRRFICQKINTATLAPNGDLVHCLHIRKPFGNIMSAPLEEIWNSENAKAFRRRLLVNNLTPLCENCPFMSPAPDSILRRIPALESRLASVRLNGAGVRRTKR